MIEVKIYNDRSFIVDTNEFKGRLIKPYQEALRNELSYDVPNAEWSAKYKEGRWDGKISLYDRRDQSYPSGLSGRVKKLLNSLSVEYSFIDERTKPEKDYPVTCDFGGKVLRDYQLVSAESAHKYGRGMLSLCTGAGKTMTSCYLFSQIQVKPVVFIVPAIELLKQTQKEFEKYLKINDSPCKVGIAGGGQCNLNLDGINVITYQTALNAFDKKYVESSSKIVDDNGEGSKPTALLQQELDIATEELKIANKNASYKLKDDYSEVLSKESILSKEAPKLRKKYESDIASLIKKETLAYKKALQAWNARQEILFQKSQIRSLIQNCKALIIDEAHLAAIITEEIGSQAKNAYYRIGLSVDAGSIIELKGDIFGSGFIGSIEQAFELLSNNGYEIKFEDGYEYIIPKDVQSRGWTGTNFDWKKVKTFIKHKNDKPSRWLKVGGTKIGFTDDHSVFVAKQNKSLELIEKCTSDVNIGDIMAYDNGLNWNNEEFLEEDYYQILSKSNLNIEKIRVVVDLSNITKEDLNVSYKSFWALKRTKYGSSLNLSQYLILSDRLPKPTLIYTEGSNGISFNPNVNLSDLGYFMGFYIGDGWIDKNKIVFAVENSLVDTILDYLNNLPGVVCHPKIREMNTGSVEISISHCVLAALMKYYFKNARCYEKRIPASWILNWDEISRRNLLSGMLDSDGHYSIKETKRSYHYTTTSKRLADDLCCLLRSLNVMSGLSVSKPTFGGIVNGRRIIGKYDKYQIFFSAYALENENKGHKGKRTKFVHSFDDFTEAKVKQIIEEPISDYVYDLEMEGHPSFVVNGILCHNSATPWRTDNQEIRIEGTLGRKIIELSASDLIERGFLVPPKIFMVNCEYFEEAKTYQEVYSLNIVNNWERNYRIKQFAEELKANSKPTLILVERKEHGEILEGMIEDAVFVPGGDKGFDDPTDEEKNYRRRMLNAVENNDIVLIATQWANVGVDAPKISCLILAGSNQSSVTTYQQVGRVLRCVGKDIEDSKTNGKECAIIVDFYSNQKNLKTHSNMRKKVYKNERAWKFYDIK